MKTGINLWLVCGWLSLLCGCDYDTPLSARPDRPVDKALTGLWEMRFERIERPARPNRQPARPPIPKGWQ